MRIIEFVTSLNDGGAERLVVDYAKMMQDRGHQVKILVISDTYESANKQRAIESGAGIVILSHKVSIFRKIIIKIVSHNTISYEFAKEVRSFKPDVIHCHLGLLHFLLPISRKLSGIRLFYTCHSEPRCFFSEKTGREYAAAKKLIVNNGLQMIALHNAMTAELNKMFGIDNTVVVRNGIDYNLFSEINVDIAQKKKSIGIPEDSFVVGHIGRFSKAKNHRFLIEIFNIVQSRKHNAHLLLIGTGELEKDINTSIQKYGIEDKVTVLSNRQDIPELLKCMDVFLFPSLYEGFPIVLVEAQTAGVNCVVSDRIPREAHLTSNIAVMELSTSAGQWADMVTCFKPNIRSWNDIKKYNMNNEIELLEKLYQGEQI